MVIVSPLTGVVPLTHGLNGLYMEVPNHLLNGMILQVFPILGNNINEAILPSPPIMSPQEIAHRIKWTGIFT